MNASTQETTPKRPREIFAAELRGWRDRRRLTQQQLSDRVAALGDNLDRATLAKIERGARNVSIDDAVVLAAALNTIPANLFLPTLEEDGTPVRVAGDKVVSGLQARRWADGMSPLPGASVREYFGNPRYEQGREDWDPDDYSIGRLLLQVKRFMDATDERDESGMASALEMLQIEINRVRSVLALETSQRPGPA